MPGVSGGDRFAPHARGHPPTMTNTIERKISEVNDSLTNRLDDLETSLPGVPSKALAVSRASARRVNDVVEGVADALWGRFERVADDSTSAVKTTTGQARAGAARVTEGARAGGEAHDGAGESRDRRGRREREGERRPDKSAGICPGPARGANGERRDRGCAR